MEKQSNTRRLTESAVLLALSVVLSLIKLTDLPFGGSVTLFSMLPVIIVAYRYGTPWGLLTGAVAGLLQMLLGMQNLKYGTGFLAVVCIILFDYIVAFGVQGLGGIFRRWVKNQALSLALGSLVVSLLRYGCHFLTGITVWAAFAPEGQNIAIYSLIYNGAYMLPETVITVSGAVLISFVLNFGSKNITAVRKKARKA